MSDTFAGLTRRVQNYAHNQNTMEELSHLVEEAREPGYDVGDALIELALPSNFGLPEHDLDLVNESGAGLAAILEEDDEYAPELTVEQIQAAQDNPNEEELDAELDALDQDDEDDDLLGEAANQLRHGELGII